MKKSFVCVLLYVSFLLSGVLVGCARDAYPFSAVSFTYGEVGMVGEGGGTVPRAMTEEELTRVTALLAELELYGDEVVEDMLYGGAYEGFYLKDEDGVTHIISLESRDGRIILHWERYWENGVENGGRYYAESGKAQELIELCRELLAAKRQPATPFAQVQIASAMWYHDEARQYVLSDTEREALTVDLQACVTYGASLGEVSLPQEHSGYLVVTDSVGNVTELRGFSNKSIVINGVRYESNDALHEWSLFCEQKWIQYRNAA